MVTVLFLALEGKKQVLIVDDEPDMLLLMRLLVEDAFPGLKVLTASTGHAGLDLLARNSVDVVISDYRMPRMDGLEFLAKAASHVPDSGRILVTAFVDDALADRAVEAGVDAFVPKGNGPERLLGEIKRLLGQK
ncbi:MAG TPA: response regulator [Candidatus Thermoplasmatota archaeon]|nr:response regulator [Candidatus Thermoplasmatota archaeon]